MRYDSNIWPGWNLIDLPNDKVVGHNYRKKNRLRIRQNYQKEVLAMLAEGFASLVMGEKDVVIPDDFIDECVALIKKTESIAELREKNNFLSLGLKRGIEILNWQVKSVPLMGNFKPERNISIDDFERQSDLNIAIKNFSESLKNPFWLCDLTQNDYALNKKVQIAWGQILFSAALYGGLLEKSALYSLLHYQDHLVKFSESDDCWITFFECRERPLWLSRLPPRMRWYLDEVTHLLLGDWQKHGFDEAVPMHIKLDCKSNMQWQDQCLLEFCKVIGFSISSRFQFLKIVNCFWMLKVPSALIYHCSRFGSTTSLPENVFEAMVRGGAQPVHKVVKNNYVNKRSSCFRKSAMMDAEIVDLQPSRAALSTLKRVLYQKKGEKRPTPKEITSVFRTLLEQSNLTPITWAIIAWLNRHHKTNSPRTLYTYLTMIGHDLADRFGCAQLNSSNSEKLATTYQLILDEASTSLQRKSKFGRLRDFQEFIYFDLGAPYVELQQLYSCDDTQQASANMITESEFIRIKSSLSQQDDEEGVFLYWIFTLLYRSGLRINELLTVHIRDVQWTDSVESEIWLYVHSDDFEKGKSPDSVRRLPLHLTMLEKEKRDFCDFMKEANYTRSRNSLLFSLDVKRSIPMPENRVRDVIQHSMRFSTGNFTLTLHHLRHSFANHVFAELFEIQLPFSTAIHYAKLKSLAVFDRSYLFLLADLMGHQSPSITISSYIHLFDIALRSYLSEFTKVKGKYLMIDWKEIISERESLKQDAWRKRLQRCSDDMFCSCVRKESYPRTATVHSGLIAPPITILPYKSAPARQLSELSLAAVTELFRQMEEGISAEDIVTNFRLQSEAPLALALAIYRVMMATNKNGGFRHIRPCNNKYNGVAKDGFLFAEALPCVLHVMRPPVGGDSQQANYVYVKLKQQLKLSPSNTLEMMRLFQSDFRVTENTLRSHNPEQAGRFLSWLKTILPSGTIDYMLSIAPNGCNGSAPPKEQIKKWLKHTNLTFEATEILPKSSSSNVPSGTAYLKVCFKNQKTSCYGYRYAITTMSTIYTAQFFLEDKKRLSTYQEQFLKNTS